MRWAPSTITPKLGPADKLALQTTWPARAAILGANGQALTTQSNNVTVGLEGSRIKDAATLTKALVAAGATQQQASSAITAAQAHPSLFEPVFTISQDRYEQLKPTLYPLPGTVFESSAAQQAITPGLSSGIVGTVGAITAQELKSLGGAYTASSVVGQTGLEASAERQLAGTPTAVAEVVTAKGAHVATLATLPGRPGTPVKTAIDPTVQAAAESALAAKAPSGKSAALVAVDARHRGRAGRREHQRRRLRPGRAGRFPAGVDVQGADLDRADRGGAHPLLGGQLPDHHHRGR